MSKIIKINKLFEKQAELYPNKIVIIDKDKNITYGELNGIANRLAYVMINQGVKPGDLVPLFVEKNIETYIAIWAILKTGAAFYLFNPGQLEKSPYPILETICTSI
jgi:acyl-CoA synthetase (AMP-forming)/AMP-acid ligase II